MKNTKLITILICVIALGGVTGGVVTYYTHQNKKELQETEKTPSINTDKKEDNQNTNINDESNEKDDSNNTPEIEDTTNDSKNDLVDVDRKPNSTNTNSSSNKKPSSSSGNSVKPEEKPIISDKPSEPVVPEDPETPEDPEIPVVPEQPTKPEEPVQPEIPEQPTEPSVPEKPEEPELPSKPEIPEEKPVTDLVITNSMLSGGVYKVANKKYNTITISNIEENAKIILESVTVNENLVLIQPGKYQLDIMNSTVPDMLITNISQIYSFKARAMNSRNKVLEGATINFEESRVDNISIHSNVEINGTNIVPNIDVNTADEVVLNIPSRNLSLNTNGVVAINKSADSIENVGMGAEININASVTELTNTRSSTIRISEGNTVTHFYNQGENTIVSGNGTITNTKISANNTRIYTEVTHVPEVDEDIDYLVRKESQIRIVDATSKTQGSVTFTLSEPVELTLNDISVICSAGKNISLFHLTTKDNTTYTLTTSYYKNPSYGLYITLPNGNIISKNFETDYANPTATDVVTERISVTEANLKLYGVDEGGTLYYVLEDIATRSMVSASDIKQNGKSEPVKVGFNHITIKELEPGKSYNLYYIMEGYFSNTTSINGPFTIESQSKEVEQSKYEIIYAKEEIRNRFVFKLNRVPEKELTLQDFEIHCPSDSSLTTKGATFYVSPDLLTYIIVIPDNYGHKDNEYTVKVQVSNDEKIEKSFATHMNPPVITGAVDGVVRDSESTAKFTFNSDEAGTVYYGIYEWNGGIYDYNTSTPFATDVITGRINSQKQVLHAGLNTIEFDLSNVTVTKNTRIWALFVDEVGNYRVGFVDHYKIPEYVEPKPPESESTLEIVYFKFTNNNFFEIEFNEEIFYNIEASDVSLSVAGSGSLPSKLLYIIDNSMPKKVTIKVQNYTLPMGEYELTILATDKNEKEVKLVRKVEVK